jgi:hypothetical protein
MEGSSREPVRAFFKTWCDTFTSSPLPHPRKEGRQHGGLLLSPHIRGLVHSYAVHEYFLSVCLKMTVIYGDHLSRLPTPITARGPRHDSLQHHAHI